MIKMNELVIEGDPKIVAEFDKEIMEEFKAQGISDQITIEKETVQIDVAPGELGFGDSFFKYIISAPEIVKAGADAVSKFAGAIAKRMEKNSLDITIKPDGTIRIKERTSGSTTDAVELVEKLTQVINAQQA